MRKSLHVDRGRCIGCNRPVGMVWFGAGPDLVELVPSRVTDPEGRGRLALLIHLCPEKDGRDG